MKNKPLELDTELNKTNGKKGEKISVSGNCSSNDVYKECLMHHEGLIRRERAMKDIQENQECLMIYVIN